MRQKLLTTILLLLSVVAPFAAFADSFKIDPANLMQGETATLQFSLVNSQDYIGFQADVTLPDGLTPVKENGECVITLDRNAGGNFNVTSNLSGKVLKMAAFSGNHTPFTGTSGALVNLKVNVSNNFAGGEVKVSNIIFTDTKNQDVKFDSSSAEFGVAVKEVSFTRKTLTLTEGENTTFVANIEPEEATDQNVTWASSDPSVATVTDAGYVVALKAGTTNITATVSGKTATCVLTVKAKTVAVTSISLNKTALNLTEGGKETLTVTFNPENATNKTITWSSDDDSVATVSATGEVTAVGEGTTTITATSNNGKEAACTVTVAKKIIAATAITLSATTADLKVNGSVNLTATVTPDNATDKTVTWTTSDAAV
ncbi:MAG: Ig-like domain-containing protein, partial [Muribaculaceae bacterium]|nr:Ig-like domain-containing protein [Muribaculaceae bacterium]